MDSYPKHSSPAAAEAVAVWERVAEELRSALPAPTFNLWIDPLRAVTTGSERLYLTAPEPVRSWVERRYRGTVVEALRTVSSDLHDIDFVSDEGGAAGDSADSASPAGHTFERFVISQRNRLAHAAALRVAESPGASYNPLFLHGEPGVGKTHLLHAIAAHIRRIHPDARVLATTGEAFTTEFVAAVRGSGAAELRSRYRNADVLLFDDVDFLEGKARTEEELLHSLDALSARGAQIVLCASAAPARIEGLTSRFRDRLDAGLTVEVGQPDWRARLAVLTRLASEGAFPPPDAEVLREIARSVPDNFRRLEAAYTRVLAHASLLGETPSTALVSQALDRFGPADSGARPSPAIPNRTGPSVDDVRRAVAAALHVSEADLASGRRSPSVTHARHIAMYLARKDAGLPLAKIGSAFNRDHSTVVHAVRTIERKLEPGNAVHKAVESARAQLGADGR